MPNTMTPKLHRFTAPRASVICLLFCGQSMAQTPGEAAFQRLDKNKDGKITRDEAPSADNFTAADADRNGAVTPEEFRGYLASRQRLQTPNPAPAPTAETAMPTPAPVAGKPALKTLPNSDAVRDAAGTGQLFECVHVPDLTDIRKGVNEMGGQCAADAADADEGEPCSHDSNPPSLRCSCSACSVRLWFNSTPIPPPPTLSGSATRTTTANSAPTNSPPRSLTGST